MIDNNHSRDIITYLKVSKLFGKYDYEFDFNEQINLLVGANGTGKTTLIKLMWYIVSGNIKQALQEIPFAEVVLKTRLNTIKLSKELEEVEQDIANGLHGVEYDYLLIDSLFGKSCRLTIESSDGNVIYDKEVSSEHGIDLKKEYFSLDVTTLFFPTFRRLGNGFGIENTRLKDIFQELSFNLSTNGKHKFVSSGSQDDIKLVYFEKKNEIDNITAPLNLELQEALTSGNIQKAEEIFKKNLPSIRQAELPLRKLANYIDRLFLDKSIGISRNGGTIGTHSRDVPIECLSSGEESLLSFLCYNMAYDDTVFFIDEPELYFHPDWQRNIVRILKEQNPTNQFFIVTHSPMIAASYPQYRFRLDDFIITDETTVTTKNA